MWVCVPENKQNNFTKSCEKLVQSIIYVTVLLSLVHNMMQCYLYERGLHVFTVGKEMISLLATKLRHIVN